MICSSVNRFFTSNLLSMGLDSKLRCYSNPGGRRRNNSRQWLSLSGALRHAFVRERQAAAWRDQTPRHGQPLLPRTRGPAPAHRHARRGVAASARSRPVAQPQAAQFCGGGVSVALSKYRIRPSNELDRVTFGFIGGDNTRKSPTPLCNTSDHVPVNTL